MIPSMTPEDHRRLAYTEVEGWLQLILEGEDLSDEVRSAYNRTISFVRRKAGIRHKDITRPKRRPI